MRRTDNRKTTEIWRKINVHKVIIEMWKTEIMPEESKKQFVVQYMIKETQ